MGQAPGGASKREPTGLDAFGCSFPPAFVIGGARDRDRWAGMTLAVQQVRDTGLPATGGGARTRRTDPALDERMVNHV